VERDKEDVANGRSGQVVTRHNALVCDCRIEEMAEEA
jgi:hypothetical protein